MSSVIEVIDTGTFPTVGGKRVACDVIKFGNRLRIICKHNDRSFSKKGYRDLNEIRREYPGAV